MNPPCEDDSSGPWGLRTVLYWRVLPYCSVSRFLLIDGRVLLIKWTVEQRFEVNTLDLDRWLEKQDGDGKRGRVPAKVLPFLFRNFTAPVGAHTNTQCSTGATANTISFLGSITSSSVHEEMGQYCRWGKRKRLYVMNGIQLPIESYRFSPSSDCMPAFP
jgi:hypothetical protein